MNETFPTKETRRHSGKRILFSCLAMGAWIVALVGIIGVHYLEVISVGEFRVFCALWTLLFLRYLGKR